MDRSVLRLQPRFDVVQQERPRQVPVSLYAHRASCVLWDCWDGLVMVDGLLRKSFPRPFLFGLGLTYGFDRLQRDCQLERTPRSLSSRFSIRSTSPCRTSHFNSSPSHSIKSSERRRLCSPSLSRTCLRLVREEVELSWEWVRRS